MRRISRSILAAGAAALLTAGSAAQPGGGTVGAAADWTAVGGGSDESSFSRLGEITPGTIGKLGLAWSLDLPGEVTLEATPLAVDGVLYFSGSYAAVYAVDALTGR